MPFFETKWHDHYIFFFVIEGERESGKKKVLINFFTQSYNSKKTFLNFDKNHRI